MKIDVPKNICEKLLNCYVSYSELVEKSAKIYGQYYVGYQKENITKTCLMKYWDFEKNGELLPQNVDIHSDIVIALTCVEGHTIYIQPSQYNLKIVHRKKKNCDKCFLHICPDATRFYQCDHHKECSLALLLDKKIFC